MTLGVRPAAGEGRGTPEARGGRGRSSATPAPSAAASADAATQGDSSGRDVLDDLRPAEIVRRLDEYIVGQRAAKRAVAVALRNRWRRRRLPDALRSEVTPKNILMIGPTGVGKTEIARRLARLTRSPFIKVEATKFTEVGYVGRDVESIIRDLLEQTITEVHNARLDEVSERARAAAEERILDALVAAEAHAAASSEEIPASSHLNGEATGAGDHAAPKEEPGGSEMAAGGGSGSAPSPAPQGGDAAPAMDASVAAASAAPTPTSEDSARRTRALRRRLRRRLDLRQLEDRIIEVEVEEHYTPPMEVGGGAGMEEVGSSLADFLSQMTPPRRRMRRMSVAEARRTLEQDEQDHLVDVDSVYDDAIAAVEEDGIVFVDEIDKIAGQGSEHGPDISGQGVQRDLLPLLEGSTVHTRYGAVHTDHILFVAAGAFTMSKPSDLIPEMQGRLPIRVELSPLSEGDLRRILVEPSNALTKQYAALLATEGVTLEFTDDGLGELARQARTINEIDEDIGARRLFTILEKVLEEVAFSADEHGGESVRVDADYVGSRLGDLVRNEDVRRYVL